MAMATKGRRRPPLETDLGLFDRFAPPPSLLSTSSAFSLINGFVPLFVVSRVNNSGREHFSVLRHPRV